MPQSCRPIDVEAELGGDLDPVTDGLERLADDLLVGEGAVDLGGVEKGDAPIDRRPDQFDGVGVAQRVAVAEIEPHAAEADRRDFEAALAQNACLHGPFLPLRQVSRREAEGYTRNELSIRRYKAHAVISGVHELNGRPQSAIGGPYPPAREAR